jgi:hypothetical protein
MKYVIKSGTNEERIKYNESEIKGEREGGSSL